MTGTREGRGNGLIGLGRKSPPKLPVVDPLMRASADQEANGVVAAKLPDNVGCGGECAHDRMPTTIRCETQEAKALLASEVSAWHIAPMAKHDDFPDSKEATARRLGALRAALGLTQEQMAERYGLGSQQTWGNYEKGARDLPPKLAVKIAARERISLDWIYRGLTDMLPLSLAQKLGVVDTPTPTDHPHKESA